MTDSDYAGYGEILENLTRRAERAEAALEQAEKALQGMRGLCELVLDRFDLCLEDYTGAPDDRAEWQRLNERDRATSEALTVLGGERKEP